MTARSAGAAAPRHPQPGRRRSPAEELATPARRRSLLRLPRLTLAAFRLAHEAAPRELVLSTVLQVVGAVGLAVQVLLGRTVLSSVLATARTGETGSVFGELAALAAVTGVVSFANAARAEQQRLLTELTAMHATSEVLGVSASVDLVTFDDPAFHDRLERARTQAVVRPAQMVTGLVGMLGSLLSIAGIASALAVLEPLFVAPVLLAYAPAWLAAARASRLVYDFAVAQTERDRRRAYLFRVLTEKDEAKEIRAFQLGAFLRGQHDRLYRQKIDDLRTVVHRRLALGLVGGLTTAALTAAAVGVLVWMVAEERMELAEAGAAAGAVVLLGQRLQALAGSAGSLYEGALHLEEMLAFVRSARPPGATGDGRRPQRAPAAARPPAPVPTFDRLVVEDVWFTYPSRDEPALRGVSMEVRRGEVVALVGENGSGKTTLAKLVAGLYEPQRGAVRWEPAAGAGAARRQASVALLFQDFLRYWLTAYENIALGRHERLHDEAAVLAAAERAGVKDVLLGLDDGLQTMLAPQFFGGSDLSLGQWQRVALARAFFRDAPFVVLDEPTASLDPRAEARLFAEMRRLFEGRTVLLISHRFSSVRSADRIYVLADGTVAEHGTHEELLARGGTYADLFRLQAAAYLDADLGA